MLGRGDGEGPHSAAPAPAARRTGAWALRLYPDLYCIVPARVRGLRPGAPTPGLWLRRCTVGALTAADPAPCTPPPPAMLHHSHRAGACRPQQRCQGPASAVRPTSVQYTRGGPSTLEKKNPMVPSTSQPSPSSSTVCRAEPGNGPSGINVQGARPTSPKGWTAMVLTLKQRGVSVHTHSYSLLTAFQPPW